MSKQKEDVSTFDNDSAWGSEGNNSTSQTHTPEPQNQEMLVEPYCKCEYCNHWVNSVDWCPTPMLNFQNEPITERKCKRIQPLIKSEKFQKKSLPIIKNCNKRAMTKIEQQALSNAVVHSEIKVDPLELLIDTYFDEDIQRSLQKMNYKYSKPLQAFAWPAILRDLNVFLVGKSKCGKTFSYLPAMCTFCTNPREKRQELSKHKGPLVIVLCPNSRQCEEIFDLIKKIYSNIRNEPKIGIITYPISFRANIDILITMPESLIYCLKSKIFNLKRLCHLVFEDTTTLLKNNNSEIYKILEVANEMLEHRVNNRKVQLIVTSQKWNNNMKKLLESIYITPLVCIEDHLEGGLYGGIQFEVKFLVATEKTRYLESILNKKYRTFKTVVLCNDTEIQEVNEWLVKKGIETLVAVSEGTNKDDIEENERVWNSAQSGQYKVLICSDFILETFLSIDNATWLIHYSFPTTWTRFTRRFSACSAHYKSPLECKENRSECKSFLIIDEQCESQMFKILNLMARLTKDFPESYQQYAKGFKQIREDKKIENRVNLCDNLKLFGKCSTSLCKYRHIVTENIDISDDLPKNGQITFKILNVKDVTSYTVQLLQHRDMNGIAREINTVDLKEPISLASNWSKKKAENIEVSRSYIHCDYTANGEVFILCHALTPPIKSFLEVRLIGGQILQTREQNLYEIPINFGVVEVYISNLKPPQSDEFFSGKALHVTKNSLRNYLQNSVLTADICLQLNQTLWLNNIFEVVELENTKVNKFDLKKHLLKLQVAEVCYTQITNLHNLCTDCGISLPVYVNSTVKKQAKVQEVVTQTAFLDDAISEVILISAVSPGEFYVCLTQFQSLLEELEKDMTRSVKTEIFDKNLTVTIGKYYLASDPTTKNYCRIKILNIQDNKALCFYVDYGDEAVIDISEIKLLQSKYLKRLPFQAIQCRLHGVAPSYDEWETEATDVLYRYMFEPDSDIFRCLYVKVCDKEKSDGIRSKLTYSILLKDCYGDKNILINEILHDCGFATSLFGKIDDFDLPKISNGENTQHSDVFGTELSEELFINFENFDLEIHDMDIFLDQCGLPRLSNIPSTPTPIQTKEPTKETERSTDNGSTSNAVPETPQITSNGLTPEIYWSQTEKNVRLKIKLIGVQQFKVCLVRKRIFMFGTDLNEKHYELKFTLYKPAEIIKQKALGQDVQVILEKTEAVDWRQLTATNKRMRNIHYEVSDVEESKKKFLQLDITDDESDLDDDVMYHNISDLDSEFDEEVEESD